MQLVMTREDALPGRFVSEKRISITWKEADLVFDQGRRQESSGFFARALCVPSRSSSRVVRGRLGSLVSLCRRSQVSQDLLVSADPPDPLAPLALLALLHLQAVVEDPSDPPDLPDLLERLDQLDPLVPRELMAAV